MKKIFIPVDFSETSVHAANYAAQLFANRDDAELFIYHMYSKEDSEIYANEKMDELTASLKEFPVKVSCIMENGEDFISEFEKLIRHREAGLVIMGITNQSKLSQTFIGSNAFKLVSDKICPVLIVPVTAEYRDIKNVMLASDFKNAANITPSGPIKSFLKIFDPTLYIVNVNSQHYIALTEAYEKEKSDLQEMFAEYNPEFYFLRLYDVDEALTEFAMDKNVDLIISVQRDHSLLHRFFRTEHTKKLAYHSSVAVLAVHE